MMTNLKKLVTWHTDVFNRLSDDGCLVCLTEKERYLLGNALEQLRWSTRWIIAENDILPDIDSIASDLDYKMSDDGCIDFCAYVLNCIETDESIQQAISRFSNSPTTTLATTELDTGLLDHAIIDNGGGCNLDNFFGAITGVVDLWDAISKDLLEIVSNLANPSARIGDLIEAIPIIGELPADDILQMIESILTDIEQGYDGAWTVQLRDEIRCDLFCLTKDSCKVDFRTIRDYHANKLGQTLTFSSLEEFLLEFYLLNVTGTATVYALHYFITQVFIFSEKITGLDIAHIEKIVASLFNDPDSDHIVLCDCDDTWTYTLDFTVSDYGFTFDIHDNGVTEIGTWTNGVGFKPKCVTKNGEVVEWLLGHLDFDQATITDLVVNGVFTKGTYNDQTNVAWSTQVRLDGAGTTLGLSQLASELPLGSQVTIDMSDSEPLGVTANRIQLSWRTARNGNCDGDATVTSITLQGTGTMPSQFV